jgi:ABC-type multidrug transport system permease subunit
LTYGVDGLRNALLGSGTFSIWIDLLAMAISTIIMISLAVYAFNRTEVG